MESALPLYDDRYRRDLGEGLVLRWSEPADAERIAALYAHVFRPNAEAPLNWGIPVWTRDMFSGRHPHIGPRDFAVVEQTATGEIVAATCLLRYQCEYEGIPFSFGRPEVVASLPEYRRQGLIRAIFELIHAKSEVGGDLMQGITGIPYYYRQFGYEYAAALAPSLTVYFVAIPEAKQNAAEPYTLREAVPDDLPLVHRLWDHDRADSALSTVIEDNYWRWMTHGMHPDALARWRIYLIADAANEAVGYLMLVPYRWGAGVMHVDGLSVQRGVPLASVMPSVLRGVRALAETTRPFRPETPPAGAIAFRLHGSHPLRDALGDILYAEERYPYAWYIRVADLPRFIRHVAPALERRLAASPQSGYTGELTLNFYRGGLRLAFERGRLTAAEDWQMPVWGRAKAGFPPLVFLKLLCGYRALDELRAAFPDVWTEGDGAPLLEALFPKRPSHLMPLD
jgi:hypothetical protein